MNSELKFISDHMLQLGLGALKHANGHSNYISFENNMWPELSVLQTAHAAEILIKARIAEEHPLLIFEHLPKSSDVTKDSVLEFKHLMEKGRTYQYSELPNRLWATTGIRLQKPERYHQFGLLRNSIQHFVGPEGTDCSLESLKFIYEVIDPFIHECWDLFAIDFNEDHEPYVYLIAGLLSKGIEFLVSPESAQHLQHAHFSWTESQPSYREKMEARFDRALSTTTSPSK